jgi:hypothetical protein
MHIITRFRELPSRVESVELRNPHWNLTGLIQIPDAIIQEKNSDQHSDSNSDPPSEFKDVDQVSFVEYLGLGFHQHKIGRCV